MNANVMRLPRNISWLPGDVLLPHVQFTTPKFRTENVDTLGDVTISNVAPDTTPR